MDANGREWNGGEGQRKLKDALIEVGMSARRIAAQRMKRMCKPLIERSHWSDVATNWWEIKIQRGWRVAEEAWHLSELQIDDWQVSIFNHGKLTRSVA